MIPIFAVTWLGVIAAQISPGPNLAAVASMSLAHGRRPSMFVVLGISTGMLVWSVATTLGLGTLLETYPSFLKILKLIGGSYLLFLGLKAARSLLAGRTNATFSPDANLPTDRKALQRGLFVVLTNPKAALMWAAVASFLFGQGMSAWHVLVFGPMGALSGLVIYGAYAVLFSTDVATRGYASFSLLVEGVFATAFGGMGASLLWSGLQDSQK
ncbi:MAG: LysE family translocator [Roseobacter sp.]